MSSAPKLQISYEFFPPKTEKSERQFWLAVDQTDTCEILPKPKFHSITYGALGSDRQRSIDMVVNCQQRLQSPIAAHITAAGQSKSEALETVRKWHDAGVKRLVVLRGDAEPHPEGFVDAVELIEGVREIAEFDISVAAYPEKHPKAANTTQDFDVLCEKLSAGGNRAITQFFFEPEAFLRLRDELAARGITQPLVPGILPIQNFAKVVDFSQRCGANVPTSLHQRFADAISDVSSDAERSIIEKQVGIEVATKICSELMREGVEHFHFYTLNTGAASRAVVGNLVAENMRTQWLHNEQ